MWEFLSKLFQTEGFPPRRFCGEGWTDGHVWLHVTSDLAIFSAYFMIPLLLVYFVMRRRDVPFLPVFWLFAAFIFSCGFGHAIEATIFWHPWYRFSGVIKLVTAIVSWMTVIVLVPVLPRALALPGLELANRRLRQEADEREVAVEKQQVAYRELSEFNRHLLDREDRIIELKREVNALLAESGRTSRYSLEDISG